MFTFWLKIHYYCYYYYYYYYYIFLLSFPVGVQVVQ